MSIEQLKHTHFSIILQVSKFETIGQMFFFLLLFMKKETSGVWHIGDGREVKNGGQTPGHDGRDYD